MTEVIDKATTFNIYDENNLLISSMYCRRYTAYWEFECLSSKYPNKYLKLIRREDNKELIVSTPSGIHYQNPRI